MSDGKELVFNNKKLTNKILELEKAYERVVGYLQQNGIAQEELQAVGATFNETRSLVQQMANEAVNTSIYHQSHNEVLAEYVLDLAGIEQEEYLQKVEERIQAHRVRFANEQKEALKNSSPQMKEFLEQSDALIEERFTSQGLTPTEEDIQLINKEVAEGIQKKYLEQMATAEAVAANDDVEAETKVDAEELPLEE